MGGFHTKHFNPTHHIHVQPYYLHLHKYPIVLPREKSPNKLQGSVKLSLGYK